MEIEDIRKNAKILIDGVPYRVDEAEFMKPGKGQAIYRLKLRNLYDNAVINRTFRSGDKVAEVTTSTYKAQFLYREGDQYVFMDTETFEQHFINEEMLGDKRYFLKEGTEVTVLTMDEKPLEITLSNFVELKIVGGEITTRTDTITAQMKSAVLETGYRIDVPPFIQEGDVIKVDTRTGTYVERVTKK